MPRLSAPGGPKAARRQHRGLRSRLFGNVTKTDERTRPFATKLLQQLLSGTTSIPDFGPTLQVLFAQDAHNTQDAHTHHRARVPTGTHNHSTAWSCRSINLTQPFPWPVCFAQEKAV